MSESPKRPEQMTAWERWQLASFDPPKPETAAPPPPPPTQAMTPPEEPAFKLPTAEDVEQIYQQARDEGYQVGFNEGQQTALAAAQRIHALADKLEAAIAGLDEQVAEELLALSMDISRQVLREAVHTQPEAILAVIHEALGQLPHQHATVFLNAEDAAFVREHLGEQLAHAGHRIQEDINLIRGDCLVEAGGTRVDATLANRWRRVVATLGSAAELDAPIPEDDGAPADIDTNADANVVAPPANP